MTTLNEFAEILNDNLIKIEQAVGFTDNYIEFGSTEIAVDGNGVKYIAIMESDREILSVTVVPEDQLEYFGIEDVQLNDNEYCFVVMATNDPDMFTVVEKDQEGSMYTFVYQLYCMLVLDSIMLSLDVEEERS